MNFTYQVTISNWDNYSYSTYSREDLDINFKSSNSYRCNITYVYE